MMRSTYVVNLQAAFSVAALDADSTIPAIARLSSLAGCDDGTKLSLGPRFADILVLKLGAVLIRLLLLVASSPDGDNGAAMQESLVSRLWLT